MKIVSYKFFKSSVFLLASLLWLTVISCSSDSKNKVTLEAEQGSIISETPSLIGLKEVKPDLKIGAPFRIDDNSKYLNITEMDIGTTSPWTQKVAVQQKDDFYRYTLQALNSGAERIFTWGINDGRDPTWRTNEHPLLWDENFEKKDAYFVIKQALEESNSCKCTASDLVFLIKC